MKISLLRHVIVTAYMTNYIRIIYKLLYCTLTIEQEKATAHNDKQQSRYFGEHEDILNFGRGLDIPTVDECYET